MQKISNSGIKKRWQALLIIALIMPSLARTAPDLELQKTINNEIPIPNESVEFTVSVSNVGDETAIDVHVEDLLPPELVIPAGMAAFPSIGSYDPATGDWAVGDLDPAESAVLTLPAMVVSANPPSCIINEASTNLPQDANADNDRAHAIIRQAGIERCVDLAVNFRISVGPNTGSCDQTARYGGDVDVINFGPDAARNVIVSLTQDPVVGPNLRFDDADCANAPAAQCNIAVIGPGEEVSIDVTSDLYQSYERFVQQLIVSAVTSDTDYDSSNNSPGNTDQHGGFSACGTDPNFDFVGPEVVPGFGGGSGSGCFIATAAYGSYLDPHVEALRQFRDQYLATNSLGRTFVEFYYRYSPPIAEYILPRPWLRTVVRTILTPAVLFISRPWTAPVLGSVVLASVAIWRRRKKKA